jgi:uncharacterized protein YcnI
LQPALLNHCHAAVTAAADNSLQFKNNKFASFRAGVKFNSTTTTNVRDNMFKGVATAEASPCAGGYNRTHYKNVSALFTKHGFKVSQNSECVCTACTAKYLLAASNCLKACSWWQEC